MMVTFVSQCEKHALKRTRRVLDAFANRIGDNTWQTLITQEGLLTVQKMLRRSASRNTAVSCHWIRSRSRSQLLWVVGQKNKFNQQGYVPVNRTEKSLLGSELENSWKYLPLINGFARLAALLHDWGKASQLFQNKLNPESKNHFKGDPLRHEWISCLLFNALVKSRNEPKNDESWLDALISSTWDEHQLQIWVKEHKESLKPLNALPDSASLLTWLIVSHHRLPFAENKYEFADKACHSLPALLDTIDPKWGYQNGFNENEYEQRVEQCFEFPQGLLNQSLVWRQAVSRAAEHLKHQLPLLNEAMGNGCWRLIAQHARLCLMLGDHNYSSKEADPDWQSDIPLYANTQRVGERVEYKQKLDEHLVNVANVASNITEYLPFFESEPPLARDINELKHDKNAFGKFSWQEDVVNSLYQYRDEQQDKIQGYFVVNIASTGCGKTTANAKIMQALSEDKHSMRFILALGLRTLTLQTGDEYRDRLGIKDDNLAVLIGSKAVFALHKEGLDKQSDIEKEQPLTELGSESQESLFGEEELELNWSDASWQGSLPEDELSTVLTRPKDRALLYAPVLACTIDHIIGATETIRGGRYILPYLRLMSSDLVIDEIDDFVDKDSIAIGRLIYLAGLLGRKVMISSATIPPTLALFYFKAYQQGWQIHALSHQKSLQIGCTWVDEGRYNPKKDKCTQACQIATLNADDTEATLSLYQQYHNEFIRKRIKNVMQLVSRRKAYIASIVKGQSSEPKKTYFQVIQQAVVDLHQKHHCEDNQTGLHVSFGVVRTANIAFCVELTHHLLSCEWDEEIEIRTMAYHSQQVLLLRHEQEQHLDAVLKRKEKTGEQPDAFTNPIIRQHLDNVHQQTQAKHFIFILVATPVEEVGRDHDFDWAVVEPSSYRSIIQMGGRVRRHRDGEITEPNMALLQYNWKGFNENESKPENVFSRPGYENKEVNLQLSTHDLRELVDEQQLLKSVDATPRIQRMENWKSLQKTNLACLEHASIERLMGNATETQQKRMTNSRLFSQRAPAVQNTPHTLWGFTRDAWGMTALSQQFAKFRESLPEVRLLLVISAKNTLNFCLYDKDNGWVTMDKKCGIELQELNEPLKQRLWLDRNYQQSLENRESEYQSLEQLSQKYGEISIIIHENSRSYYNDQFGISTFNVSV